MPNEEKNINIKVERYIKMKGIIKRHFGKHVATDTELRLHNITSKASLCYGSENWIINKRDAPRTGSRTNEIHDTTVRPYKTGPPEKP
jgi:hypothetical protein